MKPSLTPPDASEWHLETQLVRGGTRRTPFGETSEAIFMNSGFCYDSAETAESRFNGVAPGFVYSRYSNPTLAALEERLALLEGAEKGCVVASGMAAVFAALMCQLKAGDRVVASRVLFGSCHYIITQILPRFGITIELVDGVDPKAWERALTPGTTAVFIETPANPTLEVVDIRLVAKLCDKVGACLIVDNVFASPYYQKPLELGAHVVVYSTTKHLDGQGRTLGGAVLGNAAFIDEKVVPFHRHTGPAMSPFNAWLLFKSLETFPLRVERQNANAAHLAAFLEGHAKVSQVLYPGLKSHPQHAVAAGQMSGGGALIAFRLKGGKESAFRMMNALQIIDISNNLGDAKSLVTHPATTTHANIAAEERASLGIDDGMLRLSVGLEHVKDLEKDLAQAFDAA